MELLPASQLAAAAACLPCFAAALAYSTVALAQQHYLKYNTVVPRSKPAEIVDVLLQVCNRCQALLCNSSSGFLSASFMALQAGMFSGQIERSQPRNVRRCGSHIAMLATRGKKSCYSHA